MKRVSTWWFAGSFFLILFVGIGLKVLPLIVGAHDQTVTPSTGATARDDRRQFWEPLADGLGDALIIAAILGFAVERYTQLRLATDVGQIIAERVHGYHLPEDIRKRLKDFNEFDFIARNILWHIRFTPSSANEGTIRCSWTRTYEVRNVKPYAQRFHFETATKFQQPGKPDDSMIEEVVHYVNGTTGYHFITATPEFTQGFVNDQFGRGWRHKNGVRLPPCNDVGCEVHEFGSVASVTVRDGEPRDMEVKYPTSGVRIWLDVPTGYDFSTSMNLDHIAQTRPLGYPDTLQWESQKVYLPGHRFWVRVWKK